MSHQSRWLSWYTRSRLSRVLAGRYWWLPLLLVTGGIQAAATVRGLLRPFPPALDVDAAFFQHGGWYILQGASLYEHIWVPTPPFSFYLTTLLALVSKGNMLVLHILSVLLTGCMAVSTVLLIASLVSEITSDRLAGAISGLIMYSFVGFYILPTLGFGYKHLALFLGLAGIWLAVHGRPYLAGIAGAVAVATWSLNIVFPALIVGFVWKRSDPRALAVMLAGALTVTALMLIPLTLSKALEHAFEQLVIVPLQVSEEQVLGIRIKKGIRFLGLSSIFVLVATTWAVHSLYKGKRQYWWIYAGGAYFTGLVFFLDFDNFPDLFPGMAFVAIAVGLFLSDINARWRKSLIYLLMIAFLLGPVIRVGLRRIDSASPSAATTAVTGDYRLPKMQTIYWQKIKPNTCHYRLSGTERQWIEKMKQRGDAIDCGGLQ